VLDLETIPDEGLVSAVDAEPTRSYADKVDRLQAARRAQTRGRNDFLPVPYHRPVAACWMEAAERDGALLITDAGGWTDRDTGEEEFLLRTWQRLQGRTLVTFHGRGFDLPVLELRSLKLGLSVHPPRPLDRRPGSGDAASAPRVPEEHHDVMEMLSGCGATASSSLDLYAKLVGLPGKEGLAGKDVGQLYAQGALEQIAGYCMSDVLQTWLLYLRYRLLDGGLSAAGYSLSVSACRESLPALLAARLGPSARAYMTSFLDRCGPFLDELPAEPLRRVL